MNREQIRVIALLLVAVLAVGVGSMLYANKVAADSQRKWCGIVVMYDDIYNRRGPSTPASADMAREIKKLRGEFDCPATSKE